MTTLAPKLPYDHPFAGGYPRLGAQSLPSDPDAIDYLERVAAADGAAVEVGVAMAVDAFIKGCKADSAGYAGDPTRTVWDAMKSACIMCGARTLAGALVSLKSYGDELVDIDNLPTPSILNFGGTAGYWDAASKTMHSPVAAAYVDRPRFIFNFGLVAGRTYKIVGRFPGDIADLNAGERVGPGIAIGSDGVIDTTFTADASGGIRVTFNGNLAPSSLTIESLSIKEYFANPTNVANNFVSSDYDRSGGGLKGDGSTKYLDTNRANDADGQNDSHNAVYVTNAQVGALMTSGVGLTGINYIDLNTSTSSRVINRDGSVTVSGTIGSGLYASSRNNSAGYDYRTPQGSGTQSGSSVAPNSLNVLLFVRSDGSTLSSFSPARLAFYSIGSALDLAALDNRVTQLVTGIKFHSLTGLVATDYDPDTVAYIVAAYEAGGTL